MRKLLALLMTLILGLMCAGLAVADDAADTKALVENGVVMAKEKGMEPTLKAIGDPKGPFVKGDLYLFAGSLDKVTATAHPFAADKLVGPDLTNLKDSKGSQFFIKFKETFNVCWPWLVKVRLRGKAPLAKIVAGAETFVSNTEPRQIRTKRVIFSSIIIRPACW